MWMRQWRAMFAFISGFAECEAVMLFSARIWIVAIIASGVSGSFFKWVWER